MDNNEIKAKFRRMRATNICPLASFIFSKKMQIDVERQANLGHAGMRSSGEFKGGRSAEEEDLWPTIDRMDCEAPRGPSASQLL